MRCSARLGVEAADGHTRPRAAIPARHALLAVRLPLARQRLDRHAGGLEPCRHAAVLVLGEHGHQAAQRLEVEDPPHAHRRLATPPRPAERRDDQRAVEQPRDVDSVVQVEQLIIPAVERLVREELGLLRVRQPHGARNLQRRRVCARHKRPDLSGGELGDEVRVRRVRVARQRQQHVALDWRVLWCGCCSFSLPPASLAGEALERLLSLAGVRLPSRTSARPAYGEAQAARR